MGHKGEQMRFASLLCTVALTSLPALPASAQTMRCGNNFVGYGESTSSVQMKSGAPSSKYSYCKPESRSRSCEKVEEWSYNRPNEFAQILKFESGQVVSITSGDIVRTP